MKGFLTRWWGPIFPRHRWFHEPQLFSNQLKGLEFYIVRRGIDLGGQRSHPRLVEIVNVWEVF